MKKSKALIIGLYKPSYTESFLELEELCETIGIKVVDKIFQKRNRPNPSFYIGKGLLEKVKEFFIRENIDYLVIDDNISHIQRRNIEKYLEKKVYDRTEIILEIFAKHAKTNEGRLQVEIARLKYLLPYLVGQGKELSRLGGGIGTRGPGEKSLEYSKRYIKNRIKKLESKLKKLESIRQVQRKKRNQSNIYKVSIVGYTNAGKTTLLSNLAKETLLSKNEMFTTLSPVSRRVLLPSGRYAIFSDTVGFIRNLHPLIIEAFHSTLEEINFSDLIIILVDVADKNFEEKLEIIDETLESINIAKIKTLLVFNKIDLCHKDYIKNLQRRFSNAVFISAKNKENISTLLHQVENLLQKEVKI
ncbi:GTP-binding proten HflX [Thermosipho africanus H17ap60334]|uniref:GTPase HflX n=1 Tax=Thermosipho africanus TaxID=2421 RepID=UPI00028CE848|nr:GTPase HflX [Thermosipho africanus]EKF48961.1 GTP-binding proten HflX [Thermosipho africanus H17ap60334]RDI92873.1 GTP-binding protein HflX [Thermosipho africanus Ob7]